VRVSRTPTYPSCRGHYSVGTVFMAARLGLTSVSDHEPEQSPACCSCHSVLCTCTSCRITLVPCLSCGLVGNLITERNDSPSTGIDPQPLHASPLTASSIKHEATTPAERLTHPAMPKASSSTTPPAGLLGGRPALRRNQARLDDMWLALSNSQTMISGLPTMSET
jgi:hypothetical protein